VQIRYAKLEKNILGPLHLETLSQSSPKYGPAGFKSEGEYLSPIAIPYAPAHGSGDGRIGSLFALNPDVKGGGANLPRGRG